MCGGWSTWFNLFTFHDDIILSVSINYKSINYNWKYQILFAHKIYL